MRAIEIEHWAQSVIDQLRAGQPFEDFRVELKSDWPEPQKAARRLAAHLNSAQGEFVLWLVGVDEKRGVVGASHAELSSWYSRVMSEFDELNPRLIRDLNIPFGDKTVVALLFETDRAPYVIKNPARGKEEAGPVTLEVPWREGTATRSAKRSDLIRILAPAQLIPTFEPLGGCLVVSAYEDEQMNEDQKLAWHLYLNLYVNAKTERTVIIPFHRCKGWFEVEGITDHFLLHHVRLHAPRLAGFRDMLQGGYREVTKSLTIDSTDTEVLISASGSLDLYADGRTRDISKSLGNEVRVGLEALPVEAERSIILQVSMSKSVPEKGELARWIPKRLAWTDLG